MGAASAYWAAPDSATPQECKDLWLRRARVHLGMALRLASRRQVNFLGRQGVSFARRMHDHPIADLQVGTGGGRFAFAVGGLIIYLDRLGLPIFGLHNHVLGIHVRYRTHDV